MICQRSLNRSTQYTIISLIAVVADFLYNVEPAWADDLISTRPVEPTDWQFDPALLMNFAVIIWLYNRGISRLHQSSQKRVAFGTQNVACFVAGLAILLACLLSPLDPLSSQLASAHMIQHMTIMTVAAPLIARGGTSLLLGLGLPPIGRLVARRLRRLIRFFFGYPDRNLVACWMAYAIAMWAWHYPLFYESALQFPLIHDMQHLCFFVAAILFWQPIVDPFFRPKQAKGAAIFYLFTTTLHATVLGVFMTVAPTPWYTHYEGLSALWNLSALEDQQLAGLIMWMPACASYAFCAIWIFTVVIAQSNLPSRQVRTLASMRN